MSRPEFILQLNDLFKNEAPTYLGRLKDAIKAEDLSEIGKEAHGLAGAARRIEAVKLVKINKETEQLAVTGIVRQNDLAGDNSIPTTYIGDLRVEFNGKGIASADNGPGWLWRLFDKINPF